MSAATPAWYHPGFGSLMLDGLPTGELTVIDVCSLGEGSRDDEVAFGDWGQAVACLVKATIGQGRPVLYVQTHDTGTVGGEQLQEDLGSALLAVEPDRAVFFSMPTPTGGCRVLYECHVPTLHNITQHLKLHEAKYGSCLLLVEDMACASPHFDLADLDATAPPPGGQFLDPTLLAGWLAIDFAELADSRSDAPTVVVLGDNGSSINPREALRSLSRLVLSSRASEDGRHNQITCERRSSLMEPWAVTTDTLRSTP